MNYLNIWKVKEDILMKSNKKARSKYTIGPHGEIYNNQPVLSDRTLKLIEALAIEDAIKEQLEDNESEEDIVDEDKGASEGTD